VNRLISLLAFLPVTLETLMLTELQRSRCFNMFLDRTAQELEDIQFLLVFFFRFQRLTEGISTA